MTKKCCGKCEKPKLIADNTIRYAYEDLSQVIAPRTGRYNRKDKEVELKEGEKVDLTSEKEMEDPDEPHYPDIQFHKYDELFTPPLTLIPVKYYVTTVHGQSFYIDNRDPENRFPDRGCWAITKENGTCLSKEIMMFVFEPSPSSRDDGFYLECRYTLEEAQCTLKKYLEVKK